METNEARGLLREYRASPGRLRQEFGDRERDPIILSHNICVVRENTSRAGTEPRPDDRLVLSGRPSVVARPIPAFSQGQELPARTFVWLRQEAALRWGGMGNSTEHTAYLRLKSGLEAPRSGSISLNGKVVAEQIGAQIFVDGWALVAPTAHSPAVGGRWSARRVAQRRELSRCDQPGTVINSTCKVWYNEN